MHWGWFHPVHSLRAHLMSPTCSPVCLSLILERTSMVSEPTSYEIAAMQYASDMAGEYLTSIHKTDIAQMSKRQWQTLIQVIIGGYIDNLLTARATVVEGVEKITPPL